MEPTDKEMDDALEFSRVLAEVEREIISAFTAHFAGKPGQWVPHAKLMPYEPHYREVQEVMQPLSDAIEETHDYPEVLDVFHAVVCGKRPMADYHSAIVARYMRLHAQDIAELRSGINAPLRYEPPTIPAFIREASHV